MKNLSRCTPEELADLYVQYEPKPIYLNDNDSFRIVPGLAGALVFTAPYTEPLMDPLVEQLFNNHLNSLVSVNPSFSPALLLTETDIESILDDPNG